MIDVTAFDVAVHLATALDAAGVPYAIGGAIAYGVWVDPRGTHDVDINLFVEDARLDVALDVLVRAGVEIDRQEAREAAAVGAVLIGRYHGMRVDLLTPSIPFAWDAYRTRRRVRGPRGEAWYLSVIAWDTILARSG